VLQRINSLSEDICICALSENDVDYFLTSVKEDIQNKHISPDSDNNYRRIVDGFCNNKPFETFVNICNKSTVQIFILKNGEQNIGCCLVYLYADYIEFMYMHISEKFRRKGYGTFFQTKLETFVPEGTRMVIRCFPNSHEGINLADKMGYHFVSRLQNGTMVFEKVKE
jgi:RimJ/RimL family protein N-acetyltransferase